MSIMNEYYIDKTNRDKVSLENKNINKRFMSIRNIVMIGVIFTMMIIQMVLWFPQLDKDGMY